MLDSKINLDNLIQAIQKDEFEQISKIQSCALLIQDKTPEIKTILTICESYFARYYLYSFINDDGKTDIINYQFRIRNKDGKSICKKQFKLTERVKSAELKTKEGNFLLPINDLKIEINGNLDHINYLKLNGDFYYLRKVEIPTVLHGSNDWLFLINDRNDSLAQFLGIRSINSDQLNLWKDFFIKAERLSGCKILIAPNKETVFSKYYPYSGCKNKIISQLKGLEESKNFIVDPTAALQRNEKTYSKTDTHWTYYGAAIALKEIFPDIDLNIFQFNEGNRVGDIGSKLIPNVSSTVFRVSSIPPNA